MKRSKFTEAQIAYGLKQVDTGVKDEEVSRKIWACEETFYKLFMPTCRLEEEIW